MNDSSTISSEITLGDFSNTPEIFIEGYQALGLRNGVVKLFCFNESLNVVTNKTERRGAATLVIPLPDLVAISEGLKAFIAELQNQGIIKTITIEQE